MNRSSPKSPDTLVFYHYFHPDDVVSARHLTDLAVGLADAGCNVEAMPSNRSCRTNDSYGKNDTHLGVTITRIYRPPLNQSSALGRVANLIWMLCAWSFCAFRRNPDVLIVGTDPILSVLIAIPWKIVRPKTKIIHWCFDLYPDAAIASGILKNESIFARSLRWLCSSAYNRCDVIADIGICMRNRMATPPTKAITLTPWALAEPDDLPEVNEAERTGVFGETDVAIMYSGNFGEAHAYNNVIACARRLQGQASFAFSIRGNRVDELRAHVTAEDTNIRFIEFADEKHLERRLASADIHLVTLNPDWQGIVVPSKFFGSLAIGRPILFDGPRDSSVAAWIEAFKVGWHIDDFDITAADPIDEALRQHCFAIYHQHFSKARQLQNWVEVVHG